MYKQIKEPIHFVGIGGIGMSGIAEVLARMGFPVSGSDLAESETTRKLRELGIRVEIGHRTENISAAKALVVSTAVSATNPEVLEAKRTGLPIVARAEMLAEIMRLKYGLAVAGTHGKTTTTSLLASILTAANLDPTIIVGGKVDALGGNAKLGQGRFLVAEADESDGSFLHLSPVVTIITNIDNDHLDHYGNMQALRAAFVQFANSVPYYGRNVVCIDDSEISGLLKDIQKPVWTYGFSAEAEFQIRDYHSWGTHGSRFSLWRADQKLIELELAIPGEHNARNAVGALVAAYELDIPLQTAAKGLAEFVGVRRRFEKKAEFSNRNILIVDDYGHHPTEIAATLAAAQATKAEANFKRVVVFFQPHRFSRTASCWKQFAPSFANADQLYLLDIYSAGEAPIDGINSELLAREIQNHGKKVTHLKGDLKTDLNGLSQKIADQIQDGDLIITLGAGNITHLGPALADQIKTQK